MLARSNAADVVGQTARQGFAQMPISVADAERAGRLSGSHRDPFDRMLIAQALAGDLTVVSIEIQQLAPLDSKNSSCVAEVPAEKLFASSLSGTRDSNP